MKKQEKQQIIDDFKEVIRILKNAKTTSNMFICCILDSIEADSITHKYFMNSENKAKKFTLKSDIPNSWNGFYAWWYIFNNQKESFTQQQVIDLKIEFLQLLIKELEK